MYTPIANQITKVLIRSLLRMVRCSLLKIVVFEQFLAAQLKWGIGVVSWSSTKNRGHYITNITNSNKALLRGNHLKLPSLRIEICPKKGISTIISTLLFWGWDWDHQSYSREGSRFLGHTFASTLISPKWVVWSLFQLLQVSKSAPKESRSLENKNTSRGQVTSKSSQRCEGTKEGSKTGLKTWAKQKIANPNNQQFDTSNWTCWISRG